jgi:hypothetical protein
VSNPLLLIRLAWNPTGWTSGVRHDRSEGGWPKEHEWAAEDWNFARDQAVKDVVYAYAQGTPGKDAVQANTSGRWDIVFFTRHPAGRTGVVGFYRNAKLIRSPKNHFVAWKRMADVSEIRGDQLEAAFGAGSALGKAKRKQYMLEKHVNWTVSVDDVVTIPGLPGLPPPFNDWKRFHRFKNAYSAGSSLDEFLGMLVSDPDPELESAGFQQPSGTPSEVWEGRQVQRQHLVRERSSKVARQYRAEHLISDPLPPHYVCEACGRDHVVALAGFAKDVFDVHHQIPLATAPKAGAVLDPTQFCILCVLCHRLAHQAELYTVTELRDFLKNPK